MALRDPNLPLWFIQRHRIAGSPELFSLKAPLGWTSDARKALSFETDDAARRHARQHLSLEGTMIVALYPHQIRPTP